MKEQPPEAGAGRGRREGLPPPAQP